MQAGVKSLPTSIVTGFLGAGKTTLLNRLLSGDELGDALVIVNEFGEVGIDQSLIERSDDGVHLLRNGCVCCSSRGDLADTLVQIGTRRRQGTIASFSRVIVETSGVADPGPLHDMLCAVARSDAGFRPAGIMSVVDGMQGVAHLGHYAEARSQVAMADVVVLSKRDLVDPAALRELSERVAALNLHAPIIAPDDAQAALLALGEETLSPRTPVASASRFRAEQVHSFTAHSVTLDRPVEWPAFAAWLSSVVSLRGNELLRVKGMVWTRQHEGPLLIQGSHHWLAPVRRLGRWRTGTPATQLVFITAGPGPRDFQQSLRHVAA